MSDSAALVLLPGSKRRGKVVKPPAGKTPRSKKKRGKPLLEKQLDEEANEPPAPPAFDPEAMVEKLGLWWLNGADRYFLPHDRGGVPGWLDMNVTQLQRVVKIAGIQTRGEEGQATSQFEKLLVHTMRTRAVDFAASIAGSKASVCTIGTARVLIRDSPRLLDPVSGDCQLVIEFIQELLGKGDGLQFAHFIGWLKVAVDSLYAGTRRGGQCLILVGPSDCGKSRLQHQLITPLLGGRAADPKSYFFGETNFNNELIGSEHLLIEEIPSKTRYDDRQFFGERIKEVVANDIERLLAKNRDAVTVSAFHRLTISLNNSKRDYPVDAIRYAAYIRAS